MYSTNSYSFQWVLCNHDGWYTGELLHLITHITRKWLLPEKTMLWEISLMHIFFTLSNYCQNTFRLGIKLKCTEVRSVKFSFSRGLKDAFSSQPFLNIAVPPSILSFLTLTRFVKHSILLCVPASVMSWKKKRIVCFFFFFSFKLYWNVKIYITIIWTLPKVECI